MEAQATPIFPIRNSDYVWKDDYFQFLNTKIEKMTEGAPMKKIEDFTSAVFNNKAEILGQLALGLIKKEYAPFFEQKQANCPICGKSAKCWNKTAKRTVESLAGSFELCRPYFYCRSCGSGFFPLDEALGLAPSPKQYDIQELEAWLSSELPFKTAEEAYHRATGNSLSNGHLHEITQKIADSIDLLDVCPTPAEIEQIIEKISEGRRCRLVMMLAIDGAHAPLRPEPSPRQGTRGPGEWKEVKGFRLYLLDGEQIVHLISWHQVQNDKELAEDLTRIKKAGLIPEDKIRLCIIGDGAAWIWNRTMEIFPSAKVVLDFYHCSEHLHEVADVQFGKGSTEARELVEASLTRLFENDIDNVISDLKSLTPVSAIAEQKINGLIRYLINHEQGVKYGKAKRGGYHIGSGAIESANKFISHVRLKRSGAWWYLSYANNILKLRCAKYNSMFDRVIEKYVSLDRMGIYRKSLNSGCKNL